MRNKRVSIKKWAPYIIISYTMGSILAVLLYASNSTRSITGFVRAILLGGILFFIPVLFVVVAVKDVIIPFSKEFVNATIYQKIIIALILVTLTILKFAH
ncbi:hypothetical protein PV797_09355 [Clostridiaceae bacterium M8S5]|nr:hypothetical protein PV797_09355 [Clostridiaceae bacterium M8S5]